MPPKKTYHYNKDHGKKYGLEIVEYEITGAVLSVRCLFCLNSGRSSDSVVIKKSKTTKYFKHPFRTDNYIAHIKNYHKDYYEKYTNLNENDKYLYFKKDNNKIITNLIALHLI